MKKHATATQLLAASCKVPLRPCPLVHPPAQREPKPISTPPVNAVTTRKKTELPNAATQRDGVHTQAKSPDREAAMNAPMKMPKLLAN